MPSRLVVFRVQRAVPARCGSPLRRRPIRLPAPMTAMTPMLPVAAVVACGLAVYLAVAMLAPERFS